MSTFFVRGALVLSLGLTVTAALRANADYSACDRGCETELQSCYSAFVEPTNFGFLCLISETPEACRAEAYNDAYKEHAAACNTIFAACVGDCAAPPMDDSGLFGGLDTGASGDTGIWFGGFSMGGSLSGLVVEDCPSGSTANPLGLCVPYLGAAPEDTDPDDGCGPGFSRGADDGPCKPDIELAPADVFSPSGDDWWVICQPPLVAGPAGGCAVGTGTTSADPDDDLSCSPPLIPGPNDQCVPDLGTPVGRFLAAKFVLQMTEADLIQEPAVLDLLHDYGVVHVDEPEAAIEALRELSWD